MTVDSKSLQAIPFFSDLPESRLQQISSCFRIVRMPAGSKIFNDGEQAQSMFLVCQGAVELFQENATGRRAFDPFPFLLLDIVAAMEAICLSCFVLMSQGRQAEKDRLRSEIEYEVNVVAERQINQLHKKLDDLRSEIQARSG